MDVIKINMSRDDYNPPITPKQHERMQTDAGWCALGCMLLLICGLGAYFAGWL